jgi:hypothetical protein
MIQQTIDLDISTFKGTIPEDLKQTGQWSGDTGQRHEDGHSQLR